MINDAITGLPLNPNLRFEDKIVATLSSVADTENFLSKYTYSNNYKYSDTDYLSTGNTIRINDGTYNVDWVIAGFNTEYNRGDTASGKGIGLIPKSHVTTSYMNETNTTVGGYKSSYMNTNVLPEIATKLQTVLGTHLLKRRILVSNSVDVNAPGPGCTSWKGCTNNWEWIDAYCSLMSEVQVYGSRVWGGSYDVGEACQKLPLFNFVNYNHWSRSYFWLRAVASTASFASAIDYGIVSASGASNVIGVRPLIYIG